MYINSEHKKAQNFLDNEKYDKALAAFNKALKENPDHPDILSHRGVLFLHMNEKKKCLDDLKLSLELDPDYGFRYAALAYATDFFGDLDGAITLYQKAVQVEPDDSVAHNNLGLLMEKKGYQQKAQENFERADRLAEIKDDMLGKMDKEEVKHQHAESQQSKENPLPKPNGEKLQPKKMIPTEKPTLGQVSKDLITKKSAFKEFIGFVKNGFKLKENDEKGES